MLPTSVELNSCLQEVCNLNFSSLLTLLKVLAESIVGNRTSVANEIGLKSY